MNVSAELQVFLWTTGGLCHTDNTQAAGLKVQDVSFLMQHTVVYAALILSDEFRRQPCF